jgi:formate hydrogenlyase subunit 6/NADH:ubiquinone oxidoreductase subunit I
MESGARPGVPMRAHLCKRLRYRQSECRICAEICPEGAIRFEPGPAVSGSCSRCGLCRTACPTEVFQDEAHSDQGLLAQIAPVLRARRYDGAGRRLSVHCREAEPGERGSVAVPCLGSVTETFLLGAVALGANPLRLVRGDCGGCRLRAGAGLFAKALAAYEALAPVVGLGRPRLKLEQRQRSAGAFSARRGFLARMAGGGRLQAGDWLEHRINDGGGSCGAEGGGAGPTPGRTLLQALLRGAPWSPSPALPCEAQSPWASLRIDQGMCAACGTCVNLCPTGAITCRMEGDRLAHHFSVALCVNCRLCQEACPEHAITFAPELDARDLVGKGSCAITDIRLHACAICGETLPERERGFCITCRRRGRAEGRVPGAMTAL